MERVPDDRTFERFAGVCAIVVGAGGFAYAIAFVTILNGGGKSAEKASSVFLLLGGLLSTAVLVALYERLRVRGGAFALWALLLGVVAAIGSSVHGGYDLANAINHPKTNLSLPSAVDPRGLMTFGVTAIAALVFGWLILRTGAFPRNLGYLALASGVLLVVIYLGRLIVLDPKSPVLLVAALLAGFIVDPLFYVWLGMELRRGEQREHG
ncbi:MAG: hypothetical protein M3O84_07700 [Actinomycetota bacterium]|nr:hypothetical protein [Actinomycetota bacterium]